MSDPLVSVIIPTFNSSKFIEDTLESILNQTYKNIELIIIDDKSQDQTVHKINRLKDSRIRLYENEKNIGYVKTLNKLISLSKGDFIARNDHDDISLPNRIEIQLSKMINNEKLIVCGGQIVTFGNEKRRIYYPSKAKDLRAMMLFNSPIHHPTAMFRSSEIKKRGANIYDNNYAPCEDYLLWSKLSFKSNLTNTNKLVLRYRVHDNNFSTKVKESQKKNTLKIRDLYLKKYLNIKLTKAENICLNKLVFDEQINEDDFFIIKKIFCKVKDKAYGHMDEKEIKSILTYYWIKTIYLIKFKYNSKLNFLNYLDLNFFSKHFLFKHYLIKKLLSQL